MDAIHGHIFCYILHVLYNIVFHSLNEWNHNYGFIGLGRTYVIVGLN